MQGVSLDELEILRVVYGIFPTYKNRYYLEVVTLYNSVNTIILLHSDMFNSVWIGLITSPLQAAFDRVLQVGFSCSLVHMLVVSRN